MYQNDADKLLYVNKNIVNSLKYQSTDLIFLISKIICFIEKCLKKFL